MAAPEDDEARKVAYDVARIRSHSVLLTGSRLCPRLRAITLWERGAQLVERRTTVNSQVSGHNLAPLAQSAERLHGKEKVNGSIPLGGSVGSPLGLPRCPGGVAQW